MFPIADGRGRMIAFGGARAGSRRQAQIHQHRRNLALFQGPQSLQFRHRARRRHQGGHHHLVAEGYMDVIALVRAGFAHAVAPLGTALTEDQLQLSVAHRARTDPGLRRRRGGTEGRPSRRPSGAAASEGGLFAALCLPARGRGSRQLHRGQDGAGGDARRCWKPPCRCREVLWRAETEGTGFFHPRTPRRAGTRCCARSPPRSPTPRWPIITAGTSIRKCSTVSSGGRPSPARTGSFRGQSVPRPGFQGPVPPPAGDRRSGFPGGQSQSFGPGRPGQPGPGGGPARQGGGTWPPCCWSSRPSRFPEARSWRSWPFRDPSLDRLRHELLNLAASGSSLEKAAVLTHFMRLGMADLLARLGAAPKPGRTPNPYRRMRPKPVSCAPLRICARWRSGNRNATAPSGALQPRAAKNPGTRRGDCFARLTNNAEFPRYQLKRPYYRGIG